MFSSMEIVVLRERALSVLEHQHSYGLIPKDVQWLRQHLEKNFDKILAGHSRESAGDVHRIGRACPQRLGTRSQPWGDAEWIGPHDRHRLRARRGAVYQHEWRHVRLFAEHRESDESTDRAWPLCRNGESSGRRKLSLAVTSQDDCGWL